MCCLSVVSDCDPVDCSLPGFSVHGMLQTRMEWIAIPSSRGSSQPRHWTPVSHIADGFFTIWATREAQSQEWGSKIQKHRPAPFFWPLVPYFSSVPNPLILYFNFLFDLSALNLVLLWITAWYLIAKNEVSVLWWSPCSIFLHSFIILE